MRIALVIESLGAGGAERVLSLLANDLHVRGHEVAVVTFAPPATDFFRLVPEVARVSVDLPPLALAQRTGVGRNLVRILRLRRALATLAPDVILSFIDTTNVVTLIATIGTGFPVVVGERTDPRHAPIPHVWRQLRRHLYPAAAALVVQTTGVVDWAQEIMPPARVHVVPNPVAPALTRARERRDLVLGVGRLGREKGFDVLVDAFAASKVATMGWHLVIAGSGEEREQLELRATQLGVAKSVDLLGGVSHDEVANLYADAAIFVLPSRFEGFPNALLEAMAHGLAVVASDCASGPRDIITDGVDGHLVPVADVRALAERIRVLATDPDHRRELGEAARRGVRRFDVGATVARWEQILAEAAQPRLENPLVA